MLVKIKDIKTIKGKRLADQYKLDERMVYFETTGHFPRPVLLDSSNHILDGYTSYAVAREKGLEEIECTYDMSEYGYNQKKRIRTEYNSSYSWELKKMVYAKSGGICAICGQPLSINNFNIDHWKPINQGGTNEPDNLRATHKSCNRLKNDFMAEEFFSSMTTILAYQSGQNEEIAKSIIHTGIKLVISMSARKLRSFVF